MAFRGEGPAIGIDLGTTYSCVGVWQHNRVEIIPNDQGNRITPSYVSFTDTDRLIGDAALNEAASNPTNTVFAAKRLIGRRFSEASVQDDMKLWPFIVTEGSGNKPKISVRYRHEEKQFTPEEISAMVLVKMKQVAESYLGCTVKNAVVTVPAYFNDAQRQATKDVGRISGLNVMRIMDEPTAGAVAYGFDKNGHHSRISKTVLVFDLGGGTFDVSLLKINDGVFEVKATAGDTHLGGEDFDNRLLKHLIDEFRRKHRKCISHNARALRRLKAACERAKRVLSTATVTDVNVECLYDGIDFKATVTRARFEDLNSELFKRCIDIVKKCLQDARVEKTQIDDVVLIGGSTRIPMVQLILRNYFDGKELCKNIHPDEAVAYGAALQAAKLSGQHSADIQSLVLIDVTPLSLGTDIDGGLVSVLIPRNTPIPAKKEEIFFTRKDFQSAVSIKVYEGERARTDDNNFLGGFTLYGISRALRGQTKIQVCFEIDADGILSVSAKDVANGEKKEMTITRGEGRLSEEEVQRMVRDAERYRVEDEEYRNKVFAKKALDDYVYKISTVVKQIEVVRKLPKGYRKFIMGKLQKMANFLESKEILEANVYKHKLLKLKLQWNGAYARNYESFTNENAEIIDFPELDKLAICSSTFQNSEFSEED